MKTLYLAHAFASRKLIRKWELRLEKKYNVNLDNPFYDNDQRREILILDAMKDGSKEQREYFKNRDTSSLVEDDLEKVRKSDGIIAIVTKSIGTSMEIFFAARILRIPVYVVSERYAYHPWIQKHATHIFRNKAELEGFIDATFGRNYD